MLRPRRRTRRESASLSDVTVRGARLAFVGFALNRGLMFGAYIVLARLISPRDFGLFAAASIVTGVGQLFAESGMMSALIRTRERIDEAASSAFFSLLIGGILLTLAAIAIAPLIGVLFRSSRVAAISVALSGSLLLNALSVVPEALLQRRFSYLRRVLIDPLSSAVERHRVVRFGYLKPGDTQTRRRQLAPHALVQFGGTDPVHPETVYRPELHACAVPRKVWGAA